MVELGNTESEAEVADKPLVLMLMGPTASGKTDLAIALRDYLPVELISVDSALVYRGMDIGTAKPSPVEQAAAPHRLLDICDPAQAYSAADFCCDATREIDQISAQGAIPLLVGGTMMYFNALLNGMADMPAADKDIRAQIEQDAQQFGWPYVHQQLQEVDPDSAARIHPNHSQRICRALEVYRASGQTMTALRQQQQGQPLLTDRYEVVQVAIAPRQRSVLHERIARRFQQMLDAGFADEVALLRQRSELHADLPAIRAVGYRQMWEYLDGKCNYDEMVERGIVATRQLAKRQLTWLRGWPDLKWVFTDTENGDPRKKIDLINDFLNFLPKRHL